jgi:diguanylate cyclase (GGDEF)-like protein
MKRSSGFQDRFNAWLLRVGQVRVVLAITVFSAVLSVVMTGIGNVIFMPEVPWEEWFYVSLFVPVIISPIVSTMVLSLLYQLAEARAALLTMSQTDPLTGVGNRRLFIERAAHALAEASRVQSPVCVVLIDVDDFKKLNDRYGHAVGDEALIAVATICRQSLRVGDVFCRWGGEEFIVLLPQATLEQGCVLAERLRARVAAAVVEGVPDGVTISLGVAALVSSSETLDQVISNADRQLYLAKDAGKNRVEPEWPVAVDANAPVPGERRAKKPRRGEE